jgi:hypothetical protein
MPRHRTEADGGVERQPLLAEGRRCAPVAARQAERLFDAWWARAGVATR